MRVLDVDLFLELIDEVMAEGRPDHVPLARSSPQGRIMVVEDDDRVLQILAGPGSGKTENLVWRILFELLVRGTPSERVLVTTFTRKAATELQLRLVDRTDAVLARARARGIEPDVLPDPHVHDLRLGTLHSLCDALLAEFDPKYQEQGTELIDEHETTVRLARSYRYALGFSTTPGRPRGSVNEVLDVPELVSLFRAPWDTANWPGSDIDRVSFLGAAIAQHTETWIPRCAASSTPNGIDALRTGVDVTTPLQEIHRKWREQLDQGNVLDFATVQERLLEEQQMLLDELDHVFVDEYQDTNPIQAAIHTGWLDREGVRLTVVGDDDQAIYRFRGSDIACFQGLQKHCADSGISYRSVLLEENFRSTKAIVAATQAFRSKSVLGTVGMPKQIRAGGGAVEGEPVRLLTGDWNELCATVAAEVLQAGGTTNDPVDAAVLMFSTSEKNTRNHNAPGSDLRTAFERRGLRVYNPRNKTAGRVGSTVHDLVALVSYLIDPVRRDRVNGRMVEVYASHREADRWPLAQSAPGRRINDAHASFQKQFRKSEGGTLDQPAVSHRPLLEFVDNLRDRLVSAPVTKPPVVTLSAFVARLLSFDRFRGCGYTPNLFRQALFTALLEANIAPTRRTLSSLDEPMHPTLDANGQIEWPAQYWTLLHLMGAMLSSTDLDDEEVEAFGENAVAVLTFHQAKGLEFDHVYVAGTGRDPQPGTPLRTALFSGTPVPFTVVDGQAVTTDPAILELAAADREREVYVALTRAKRRLTVLHDPTHERFMRLNPTIQQIFAGVKPTTHPHNPTVEVRSLTSAAARKIGSATP